MIQFLKYSFVLILFSGLSAQSKRDSLHKIIRAAKEDSAKVNAMNRLAADVVTSNLDSAVLFTERALELFKKPGNESIFHTETRRRSVLAYTNLRQAVHYNEKSEFKLAEEYLKEALKLYSAENDKKGVGETYGTFGLVNMMQARYPQALEYFFKALKLEESIGFQKGILDKLGNIGTVYNDNGEFEKAMKYYTDALKLAEELKDKDLVSLQYGNMAIVYSKQGDHSKARDYFFKALRLQEELGNKIGIARYLINIGISYKFEKNFEKALEFLLRSLKMSEESGSRPHIVAIYLNIGDLYTSIKKFRQAEEYLTKGLELTKPSNNFVMIMTFENYLSELYSQMGNHKKALEHYVRFHAATDSVFNIENAKKNVSAELNYNFEKKAAAQKSEHEKEVLKLEAENQLHRTTRNFIIALAVSFLLIVVFGFVGYNYRKNLRIRQLHSQQLISSQEKERQRISKELHDSIGQNILFIKNQVSKLNDKRLMLSVDETLEEVRTISKDLYPNQLEKYGLGAAVDALVEKLKMSSEIFVSHDMEGFKKNIPIEKQISIYRVIQECISNVYKHADATALRITAVAKEKDIELVIQDNGKGFENNILRQKAQKSFGILNLEERVKLMNGKAELETSPGNGTKWKFIIPV